MRCAMMLLAGAGLAASANADVFISEVVDGDLFGGNPKWFEICNTGSTDVAFGADDFVRIYFNGSDTPNTNVSLEGVTVPAGAAIVIASSANDGQAAFENTYGLAATAYTGASFGNGNDVYSLENAAGVVDIFGLIGVDGAGEAWEYTDSFAFRNFNVFDANPSFTETEWTFGGPGALEGADAAEATALLQQNTTPFTHIPTPGAAALLGLAGLIGARRRRA